MSNGNGGNNCGEIVRSGNHMYILDTKGQDPQDKSYGKLGPLAVLSLEEYDRRLALVKSTKDGRHLFDTPEQHDTLVSTEISAIAAYAGKGALDSVLFEDGHSIIARQSQSDIETAQPTSAIPHYELVA